MRIAFPLTLSIVLLAACAPRADESDNPAYRSPTQAEIDAYLAEGPEPALRRITMFDYLAHYRLMEATGMVEALGGEARAIAALKALGEAYERRLRGAEADAPRMIPAAFDEVEQTSFAYQIANGQIRPLTGNDAYAGPFYFYIVAGLIKLGATDLEGRVQILDGLKSGERVVVYSQKALTADSRFKVVDSLPGILSGIASGAAR